MASPRPNDEKCSFEERYIDIFFAGIWKAELCVYIATSGAC